MIIRCIQNTADVLFEYERRPFGTFKQTEYGLEIGKEFLVMGMIMSDGFLSYLIDDHPVIGAYPYQLFGIVDGTVPDNWYFKSYTHDSQDYVNKEAVWGYYELVFEDDHYYKLIEMEEESHRIYFKRKIELEDRLTRLPSQSI